MSHNPSECELIPPEMQGHSIKYSKNNNQSAGPYRTRSLEKSETSDRLVAQFLQEQGAMRD